MYCLKRIMLAGLFIVPVLFTQSAWAVLEFLPESSYYQGRAYNNSDPEDSVRVDYAIYITRDDGSSEFTDEGYAAPGDGQYTYVYQVFNNLDGGDSIDLFRVFGIEQEAISENDQISSEDDQEGGIATDLEYFNPSFTDGIWEFEQGILIDGEHSWFLVISSDNDFIAGGFTINDLNDELPIPEYSSLPDNPSIPEPATMILFGIGSIILMAKRKDSVGISRRR